MWTPINDAQSPVWTEISTILYVFDGYWENGYVTDPTE